MEEIRKTFGAANRAGPGGTNGNEGPAVHGSTGGTAYFSGNNGGGNNGSGGASGSSAGGPGGLPKLKEILRRQKQDSDVRTN